eukprot:5817760-Prymnesium_polylepis.2
MTPDAFGARRVRGMDAASPMAWLASAVFAAKAGTTGGAHAAGGTMLPATSAGGRAASSIGAAAGAGSP